MAGVARGARSGVLWLAVLAAVCAGLLACAPRADAYLYYSWQNSSGQYGIGRENPDATGPTSNFIGPFSTPIAGVAVDQYYVYWASPGTQSIGRANLDGTGVNPRFITGVNALGVGVDNMVHYWKWRHIYWTDPGGNAIGRAVIDGSSVQPRFITGANNPQGVGVLGTWVFWRNADSVGFFNGSAYQPIINQRLVGATPNQVGTAELAVNHSYVYWGWSEPNCEIDTHCMQLARANLDGSNVVHAWALDGLLGVAGAIVADDNHLWYANAQYSWLDRFNADFSPAPLGPNRFPGDWLAIDPPSTAPGLGAARITNLSQSAGEWRAGGALAQYARKVVPVGTTFSYTLSRSAVVTLTFRRTKTGRRIGTIRHSGHSGRNRVHFDGRLNRRTRLAPGAYTLTATATPRDTSSPPASLRFTVRAS